MDQKVYKKNIIKLNNKPLIQYTLDLCRSNIDIDDYFISTDSNEIKKILLKLDYNNDYQRPKYLATDSHQLSIQFHGVKWYEKKNKIKVNSVMLLQPTSPIRNINEINSAIKFYRKNNLQSLLAL